MKKLFSSLFIVTLLACSTANAQYAQGDKLLNLGIGLNGYYGGGLPIGASFEYGVTDQISVGAQIDYYTWNYGYVGYKWRYTFMPIALRGSYHVNELLNLNNDQIDLYGGVQLGYYISSFKDDTGYIGNYNNAYGNQVLFGIHLGGKYYFKPNLGAFAEVGYGVSAVKLGLALKF
ncbi:hypothetical protein [Salmonirosea aquatica]|uniref:Outer membrane beta-barrel protein n=1 Tax=Salmonirosea aquatica TaxID=2654236 RepID=A0A7C9FQ50_9BACT|nr:hypothetical protein [Cytophagaceae bacterium SJW1-29]